MSRLSDLVAAGVVCAWSGAQRRPLRGLDRYTVQGHGSGTAGDALGQVTRAHGRETPMAHGDVPVSVAGELRFGRVAEVGRRGAR